MVLSFCAHNNLRWKLLLNNIIDDKPVVSPDRASTKRNSFLVTILYPSILKSTLVFATSIFSPTFTIMSTNNKFIKQFIKTYLEAQVQTLVLTKIKSCKLFLKAFFCKLYLDNLHLTCFEFF